MKKEIRYRDAGVDIDAANSAVERIRKLARSTFTPRVISDIGSFGGMFRADFSGMAEPVLVASADGVGTKLRVAFMTGIHDTIGYDLVCHCVNDILVQGARPLFFLDYIAAGHLDPEVVAAVADGLARGCREAGCVLLGGETAEMPGFYSGEDYDLAGFIVGVVDRQAIIDGSTIKPGDLIVGLPAAGLHTNGYSLARKLLFEVADFRPGTMVEELGCTVAEELLKPHRSYLKPLEGLVGRGIVKGLAHITGGGLLENLPRILPRGAAAQIRRGTWPALPIYDLLARTGSVSEAEMFRTFNMGIGMAVVCSQEKRTALEAHLDEHGENYYDIGLIVEGAKSVSLV